MADKTKVNYTRGTSAEIKATPIIDGQITYAYDTGVWAVDTDGVRKSIAAVSANGMPTGGRANQIMEKQSTNDYDVKWVDAPNGPIERGAPGEIVMTDADGNPIWGSIDNVTDALVPAGGSTGQVLTKSSNNSFDAAWQSPQVGGSGDPREPTISFAKATGIGSDAAVGVRVTATALTHKNSDNPTWLVDLSGVAADSYFNTDSWEIDITPLNEDGDGTTLKYTIDKPFTPDTATAKDNAWILVNSKWSFSPTHFLNVDLPNTENFVRTIGNLVEQYQTYGSIYSRVLHLNAEVLTFKMDAGSEGEDENGLTLDSANANFAEPLGRLLINGTGIIKLISTDGNTDGSQQSLIIDPNNKIITIENLIDDGTQELITIGNGATTIEHYDLSQSNISNARVKLDKNEVVITAGNGQNNNPTAQVSLQPNKLNIPAGSLNDGYSRIGMVRWTDNRFTSSSTSGSNTTLATANGAGNITWYGTWVAQTAVGTLIPWLRTA